MRLATESLNGDPDPRPPGPEDLVGDREKRGSAYEQLIVEAEEVGVTCGRLLHRRAV